MKMEEKEQPAKGLKSKKQSKSKEVWRRMKKNKPAMVGLVVITIFVFFAIFADLIRPYEIAITPNTANRLVPPNSELIFGGDSFGRCIFARVIHGARVSLSVGLFTTFFALLFGGLLGACAAYYGRKADEIIMRLIDMLTCIPAILLTLAIIAALGTTIPNMLIAITIASIPGFTRLTRSVILTVAEQDFIEAAKSYGSSGILIILKYIMPNAMGPIIVQSTMAIAGMILTVAALSFIGMGIQPPAPEWGAMLSDARAHMRTSPHMIFFPGVSILLAALSLNLIGDGLRDALDPKLRD